MEYIQVYHIHLTGLQLYVFYYTDVLCPTDSPILEDYLHSTVEIQYDSVRSYSCLLFMYGQLYFNQICASIFLVILWLENENILVQYWQDWGTMYSLWYDCNSYSSCPACTYIHNNMTWYTCIYLHIKQ